MLNDGSRQSGTSLDKIDFYHKERYHFASFLCNQFKEVCVIDCGCGIGYGSYILSWNPNIKSIFSFDICDEAIEAAKTHYKKENITFTTLDFFDFYRDIDNYKKSYNAIVCFEVLEHIFFKKEDIIEAIRTFYKNFDLCVWSLPLNNHSKFHKIVLSLTDLYDILRALAPEDKKDHICKGRLFIQENAKSGNRYAVSFMMKHHC